MKKALLLITTLVQSNHITSMSPKNCWHISHSKLFNRILYDKLTIALKQREMLKLFEKAVRNFDATSLEITLMYGVPINICSARLHKTALMYWSTREHTDNLVMKLLQWGANPNIQNDRGKTALMYATKNEKTLNMIILIAYGANPHLQDIAGNTALDYAQDQFYRQHIQHGINRYHCMICNQSDQKTLQLLPCDQKHLHFLICSDCLADNKAKECPLCKNQ